MRPIKPSSSAGHAVILLLCFVLPNFGQTLNAPANIVNLGAVDASGAVTTKSLKSGNSLPPACGLNELFFKSNATAGANVYGCTAPNIWTVQSGVTITAGTGIIISGAVGGPYVVAIDPADVARLGATNTFVGANDFSGATQTKPARLVSADPGTCGVGEKIFNTTSALFKSCLVANIWTAEGAGGASSVSLQIPVSDVLSASTMAGGGTTPTAFATAYTIPASGLITGKSFRATYNLAVTSSVVPLDLSLQLNLHKAGTDVVCYYQAVPSTPTAGPVTVYTAISFIVSGTAAASGAAPTMTGLTTSPSHANSGPLYYRNFVVQPISADTTSAQSLQLRIIYSGNTAGNSVQLLSMLVEPLG